MHIQGQLGPAQVQQLQFLIIYFLSTVLKFYRVKHNLHKSFYWHSFLNYCSFISHLPVLVPQQHIIFVDLCKSQLKPLPGVGDHEGRNLEVSGVFVLEPLALAYFNGLIHSDGEGDDLVDFLDGVGGQAAGDVVHEHHLLGLLLAQQHQVLVDADDVPELLGALQAMPKFHKLVIVHLLEFAVVEALELEPVAFGLQEEVPGQVHVYEIATYRRQGAVLRLYLDFGEPLVFVIRVLVRGLIDLRIAPRRAQDYQKFSLYPELVSLFRFALCGLHIIQGELADSTPGLKTRVHFLENGLDFRHEVLHISTD